VRQQLLWEERSVAVLVLCIYRYFVEYFT